MTASSSHITSLCAVLSRAEHSIDSTPRMNVFMPVNTGILYKIMRKLIHLPQQVSLQVCTSPPSVLYNQTSTAPTR